jgi:hypothetical protein
MHMRGTGIDSDVEIYSTKQSNEHQYMELKRGGGSVCVSPYRFLGNGSVNTFPWQQRNHGGVVFCAIRVVSKKNRRLVLRRTSYHYLAKIYHQLSLYS